MVAAIFLIAIILGDVLLLFLWYFNFKKHSPTVKTKPFVSVLIAVRNEEANIANCLLSILKTSYPQDKYEIIVGNDGSTDKTHDIVSAISIQNNNVHLVDITECIIKKPGKANVLAQLAQKARGDVYMFTDADIEVSPNWISAMQERMDDETGLITGVSVVEGHGFLSKMQTIEWLLATSMIKVTSDMGIASSSLGNNMAISKEAYWKVGGFEKIPFSVTEDFEIFRQISKYYPTKFIFNKTVLNKSRPIDGMMSLLIQRKRWMHGAFRLPLFMVTLLIMQTAFLPILTISMFQLLFLASALGLFRLVAHLWFLKIAANKISYKVSLLYLLAFPLYSGVFSILTLIYYFLPIKIVWKGRKY